MKEIEIAAELLQQVLENQTSFLDALKETFQKKVDLRPYRSAVAGLLGCELRHHLLMKFLCKDLSLEDEEARFLYLGLANNFYYKHLDAEEVKAFVLSKLSEDKKEAALALFDRVNEEELIPASVDRESRLYLSLRYNTPEWAIKILLHYGSPLTFRCLRKFSRPSNTTLRLRTSLAGSHALDNDPNFEPSSVEGIYSYKGKVSLRKNELFRSGKIFQEKMLIKAIVDEHRPSPAGEVLLYNGNADMSFEMELIESYGHDIGLNLACPDEDTRLPIRKLLKAEGLSNVNLFSAKDPGFMDVDISRPQDLVFAVPNSTNFDLIPETPDYLLHFDTGKMDELLAQEKAVLEGASKYVDVGGKLIYIVFTLSKKEGKGTVSAFLKVHPEFKLLQQNEYFPFAKYETAAYVAVMEKVENALQAPSPLTDLAPIKPSETYSASASSK